MSVDPRVFFVGGLGPSLGTLKIGVSPWIPGNPNGSQELPMDPRNHRDPNYQLINGAWVGYKKTSISIDRLAGKGHFGKGG